MKLIAMAALTATLLTTGCTSIHHRTNPSHSVTESTTGPATITETNSQTIVLTNGAVYTRTEKWENPSRGGGVAWLTDPTVLGFSHATTNQAGLGGGQIIQVGTFKARVSTNAAPIIKETGGAAGNVAGAIGSDIIGTGPANGAVSGASALGKDLLNKK